MVQASIEVVGARELRAAIRRAEDRDLAAEMRRTHLEAAEVVAYEAQTIVPVLSSRLLESIRAAGTATGGLVRAGRGTVPYAGPVHFGWPAHGIEPNPFLYDAADARADEVIDRYTQAAERVLDKLAAASTTGVPAP